MSKNVYGYLRVSGKGQLLGDGFDRQREEIEKYAADNGLVVSRWFEEKGVPGKTDWDDRDAWVEMIDARPDIVIVEAMERLAREFVVQEIFYRDLGRLGVKVLSAREPNLDNDNMDASRKLIRGILGLLAEYDKSKIEARLRAARNRIRQATGRCEGRKPYGRDESEKGNLNLMLSLYNAGMGPGKLAEELNARKIPARRGGKWHKTTVANIIGRVA